MKVTDIAAAIAPNANQEIVGIRPGEKLHEQMIGLEDAPYTYEYENHYKILPLLNGWNDDHERIKNGVKVEVDFVYSSNNNTSWMSQDDLSSWILENAGKIIKI